MARKYTTNEVCDLVMEDNDHEMKEYIFSGTDAEVLDQK